MKKNDQSIQHNAKHTLILTWNYGCNSNRIDALSQIYRKIQKNVKKILKKIL